MLLTQFAYFCLKCNCIMKKMINLTVVLLTSFLFISCAVGHYLDKPAYVYIEGVENIAIIAEGDKYILNYDKDEYSRVYFAELEKSMQSYNMVPVYSMPTNSENYYKLSINKVTVRESFNIKEVYTDTTSTVPEVYNLAECDFTSDFSVYKAGSSGWHHVKDKTIIVSKEEEVNNNRTFFQILFGANKDNTVYTYHELSSDIFKDLAEKCARRVAAKTSSVIGKEMK